MAKISKEQVKALVNKLKHRKQTEGKVNIENVSSPKKPKPKKMKQQKRKPPQPASVSIGSHGGRYVQEASGHKRYMKEGSLSGVKRIKKSLEEFVRSETESFIKSFKRRKENE